MKELEHLGWCHLLGWGWGPFQGFDLNALALLWAFFTCWSSSALDRQPGGEAVPFTPHRAWRKVKNIPTRQGLMFWQKWCLGSQHGDSLAPLLLESWDLRCTLLMSCLCWVYVRLTDKSAWLFTSQSSPVFCAPVWWGLDFISLGSDYTWERNIGKKMKHQIFGSDFAKLGTGPEEEMTLIKVNPGNQHSGASNAFLVWFIDVVFTGS